MKKLARYSTTFLPTESRIGCIVNLVRVLIELLGQTKQTVSYSPIRPSMVYSGRLQKIVTNVTLRGGPAGQNVTLYNI